MKVRNLIFGGLVFVVLVSLSICAIWYFIPSSESRGQFGDMFGVFNALFSGLAFGGIIITILLQRRELSLQREELKLTREELKRSAEAQEKSQKALSKQAESLKVTAKLNGLSARLQHYNTLIGLTNDARYGINTAQYNSLKQQADEIINEIRRLTEDK